MPALKNFTPGPRLIDGSLLNLIVAAVNNLTGNGTPQAVSAAALSATGNANLQGSVFAVNDITAAITAHAGGGQANATQLASVVNIVSTVATAADSVKLPAPTYPGQVVIVVNADAAESMQVFGAGTDTINGVATGTGVAQAAGKAGIYTAVTTGAAAAWWRVLSA